MHGSLHGHGGQQGQRRQSTRRPTLLAQRLTWRRQRPAGKIAGQGHWPPGSPLQAVSPTFTAGGMGARMSGYKLFIGDLPPHATVDEIVGWLRDDPALGQQWMVDLLDVSVSGGASSGACKAILVMASAEACRTAYHAIWRGWAACPKSVEAREWRWFAVR